MVNRKLFFKLITEAKKQHMLQNNYSQGQKARLIRGKKLAGVNINIRNVWS